MICSPVAAKSFGTLSGPSPQTHRMDLNGVASVIVGSPDSTSEAITTGVANPSSEPSIVAVIGAFHVPGRTWVGAKLSGMPVPFVVVAPLLNDHEPSLITRRSAGRSLSMDPERLNRPVSPTTV